MAENRRIEGPKMSIQNAAESSRFVTKIRSSRLPLVESWRSSRTNRFTSRVQAAVVAPVTRWFSNTTKRSYLHRWLTKEPEPEVIVIDLRDTVTVGPLITLLDRLVEALTPTGRDLDRALKASTLYRVGDGVTTWLEWALDSRTGRLLVALLEPPELPEHRD